MNIFELKFIGLIASRPLNSATGPEFINTLKKCGWSEETGTHFFHALKKDGPTRGIISLAELERAIHNGNSVPGRDSKTFKL